MCSYLAKRGSTYYFRRAIPAELQTALGRAECMVSLGTKDRSEAKRLVAIRSQQFDREMDEARLNPPQAPEALPQRVFTRAEAMAAARWENAVEAAEVETRAIAAQDRRHENEAEAMAFYERRLAGSTAELPPRLRRFRYMLDEARAKGQLEAERMAIRKANRHSPIEHTDAVPASGTMLDTDIVDRWAAERKVLPKTKDASAAAARWFYDHAGRIPVDKITRRHILAFKDKLLSNGQSAANTNTKVSRIATLMQWAVDNELATDNPAKGVTVKDPDKGRNKRKEFDLASLNTIFSSAVYAQAARPTQGRGEAAYWLPLLALFTGARLEELAQLRPEDVREIAYPDASDGNASSWFIRIKEVRDGDTDTDTQLKNAGSERDVPLHPELSRLGFLSFVNAAKEGKQARVFPALRPGAYGRLGAKWGEWFSTYLRTVCMVTDKRLVFHSFRHTFKQYARHAGIVEGVQRQIMGHSSGDVADKYGSGQPLHQVVAGMAMYRVPGLVLTAATAVVAMQRTNGDLHMHSAHLPLAGKSRLKPDRNCA